ncbi:MAG: D-aminoacyl-tRNA deacylase [Candidatus Omnitrophota bacterium]
MRVLLQRVNRAKVSVDGKDIAAIDRGLLLLVGIGRDDSGDDITIMANKVSKLRVFEDAEGKMNLDLTQAHGAVLSVPQFTLYADTRKGNRPGFDASAAPDIAKMAWKGFNEAIRKNGIAVCEGEFGAHMEVELTNDGPVTIWLDSKEKL